MLPDEIIAKAEALALATTITAAGNPARSEDLKELARLLYWLARNQKDIARFMAAKGT